MIYFLIFFKILEFKLTMERKKSREKHPLSQNYPSELRETTPSPP